MGSEIVNPLWLRVWHGAQALLLVLLVLSGISMHYAGTPWAWQPFQVAIRTHNIAGISTAVLWAFFAIRNVTSGRYRQYIPADIDFIHSTMIQLRYYAVGMFKEEAPPISPGLRNNHIQQLVYTVVMYVLLPISILSGLLLLFPAMAPEHFLRRPGLWTMAIIHLSAGYLISLFVVVHIYLATTGATFLSLFREMITGVRVDPLSESTRDRRDD